jgi:hypothetical protein
MVRVFEQKFGSHDVTHIIEELDSDDSTEPPYLSEEHQLNELRTRMENYGFRTVGLNIPFMGDPTLGEIDGLFSMGGDDGGDRVLVLVEAKMRGGRKKGLAQLGKYGLALALGSPDNTHIRTFLMTGRELEAIGQFGWSDFEWPAELEM